MAGVPTRWGIEYMDLSDNFIPIDQLAVLHSRLMHVLVISNNYEVFWHIHPEDFGNMTQMSENELYYVDLVYPYDGPYTMAVDILHRPPNGSEITGTCSRQFWLSGSPDQPSIPDDYSTTKKVKGLPFGPNDYYVDPIFQKNVSANETEPGFTVQMTINMGMGLFANYCSHIEFYFENEYGQPATNELVPYLNAGFHIAFMYEDNQIIYHEHGMLPNGQGMKMNCTYMALTGWTGPSTFGPRLMTMFNFPMVGKWTLFLQAKHNSGVYGTMIFAMFQVNVTEGTMPTMDMTSEMPMTDESSSENPGWVTKVQTLVLGDHTLPVTHGPVEPASAAAHTIQALNFQALSVFIFIQIVLLSLCQ